MYKTIKLQIYPNKTQLETITATLGCCRFIRNNYNAYNINRCNNGNEPISKDEFVGILNNLAKENPKYSWISDYSRYTINEAASTTETSFKLHVYRHGTLPPKISKKRATRESYYFYDRSHDYYTKNVNKIKIPSLGKVRVSSGKRLSLSEMKIISGRVVREYNKYYIVLLYYGHKKKLPKTDVTLGIDLGIKDYAIISDGQNHYKVPHYRNDKRYKELSEKVSKLQSIIYNKIKINSNKKYNKDIRPYNTKNIIKLINKLRRYTLILNNIRYDFINKLCNKILVKFKPKCISVEGLGIKQLLEKDNKHSLHNKIQYSDFYMFRITLLKKCHEYGIKLRILNRYYPSTKLCSNCGNIKNMELSDRIYICPKCGIRIHRDINSALNLRNAEDSDCYSIYA